MKEKSKLILPLLIILCFLVLAVASGSDDDTPARQPANAADGNGSADSGENGEDETFGLNETAVFNNINVTATRLEKSEGGDFNTPSDGNIFVGVRFIIENTSDEDQHISTMLLFNAFADDVALGLSISASMAFGDGTLDGTISAGRRLEGYYAVEVPIDTQTLDIEMQPGIWSTGRAVFTFDLSE